LVTTAAKITGRLPVTFENFENYGIDRGSIAPAIREDPARLEDTAVIQNRIAMRIGSDGWIVLGNLPAD
jgi:hypothetical protein